MRQGSQGDKPAAGATRLSVLLARKSPIGVVFRRGPSKAVAVISWDTDRDEFRLGQWLKGRIYEHRCDLSPSGQKLMLEYRVLDRNGNVVLDLGRSDWADWSRDGDLLFAREGCLFRTRMNKRTGPAHPQQLIDLRSLKFEAIASTPEALRWGGQPVVGSLLSNS